ncbi:MAG TPA: PDZ domain-containing protein, partial [Candidatus Limnocylindrales bacterium]|nr:PDZ domain-containing protein [Candidatus Limnocylindrales bacterium]
MDQKTIDRAAAGIAAVALFVGLSTIVWGRFDSGIRLATSGPYVVVSEVQPRSIASQYGLRPGMIVTELQGVTLVKLPQYIWPDVTTEPTPDPNTGEVAQPTPVGILPPTPTVVPIDPVALANLLSTNPTQLTAIDPALLENTPPENFSGVQLYDDGMDGIRMTLPSYVLGVALLVLVGWWLASG